MTLSRDPRRLADQLRTKAAKCGSYTRIRDEYIHIAEVLDGIKSKGPDMSDEGDYFEQLTEEADRSKHLAELFKAEADASKKRIAELETENTYLRKIADAAARNFDEAMKALETAEADALEKAAQRAEVSPDSHWGPTIAAAIRLLKPKAKAEQGCDPSTESSEAFVRRERSEWDRG